MTETSEQARTRRRWITLAEFVAVAGLLIGVLTLYLNWAERREDKAAQAREAASERQAKDIVTLTAVVADDGKSLALTDPDHTVSAATIQFPTALGIAAQDAMPGPHIDADWIADPLLKLTDGGADDRTGRLPVLITVDYWDGDVKRSSSAHYDILWRIESRTLRGRRLRLSGLVLADRSSSRAAIEAAWRRVAPKP